MPPYDFDKSIRVARLHTVLDVIQPGEYWRAMRVDSQIALVRVTSSGTIDQPLLHVDLMASTGDVDTVRLLDKVALMLSVDADLRPFYAFARDDAILWQIVEPLYGLKHVRAESVFEALATTIIEQQIALSLAQRGERWLVQTFGESIRYGDSEFFTFPTPERIAPLQPEDLLPLKITTRRMQVMIDVARQMADGAVDLSSDRLFDSLLALHGIGRWTAAWTIIRSQGNYEYVGENDVALQAAINHFFYGETGRTTPQRVQVTLARYGKYAGAVAFFTLIHWGLMKYP